MYHFDQVPQIISQSIEARFRRRLMKHVLVPLVSLGVITLGALMLGISSTAQAAPAHHVVQAIHSVQ